MSSQSPSSTAQPSRSSSEARGSGPPYAPMSDTVPSASFSPGSGSPASMQGEVGCRCRSQSAGSAGLVSTYSGSMEMLPSLPVGSVIDPSYSPPALSNTLQKRTVTNSSPSTPVPVGAPVTITLVNATAPPKVEMPPPMGASLPAKVLLVTVATTSKSRSPPPWATVVLAANALFSTVTSPLSTNSPPPWTVEALSTKRLWWTAEPVAGASRATAPPRPAPLPMKWLQPRSRAQVSA